MPRDASSMVLAQPCILSDRLPKSAAYRTRQTHGNISYRLALDFCSRKNPFLKENYMGKMLSLGLSLGPKILLSRSTI